MVGNHEGIHEVIFGQVWIGFLEFLDLLGIEDMNFPLKPAQAAILSEGIHKVVPVDRGSFQADYHTLKLHGAQCRHDFL